MVGHKGRDNWNVARGCVRRMVRMALPSFWKVGLAWFILSLLRLWPVNSDLE